MTTIAADAVAGVMCSDSRWTDTDTIGAAKKIWRVRHALLGAAGDMNHIAVWLDLYRKNKPLRGSSMCVLRLQKSGIDCWTAADGWIVILDRKFAIGSGGGIARGAMAAGATCAQAVRIASDIDANTRGPVRTYKLKGT